MQAFPGKGGLLRAFDRNVCLIPSFKTSQDSAEEKDDDVKIEMMDIEYIRETLFKKKPVRRKKERKKSRQSCEKTFRFRVSKLRYIISDLSRDGQGSVRSSGEK